MFFYGFMQRAFTASILISVIAPILGLFLILRRQTLLADTLSHISLTGLALGLMLGINATWSNLAVVIFVAILLEYIRHLYRSYSEISISMLMSGGMAAALMIMSLNHTASVDLNTFLFGSIVTISSEQLYFLIVLTGIIVALYLLFKKPMYVLTFDEETAFTTGLPVRLMSIIFNVLTGVAIAIIMPIVGSLLVSAILILPAAIAMRISHSFRGVILMGMVIAMIGMFSGLYLSYNFGTPSGASVVSVFIGIFVIVISMQEIKKLIRR